MKQIESAEDFAELQRAERAVLFISFAWSKPAEVSWNVFNRWAAETIEDPAIVFAELAPDELPFSWQWVNGIIGYPEAEAAGRGAVIWLQRGAPSGFVPDAARAGSKTLTRITRDYFVLGKTSTSFTEALAELDVELLKIICCPETHQELRVAAAPMVASLNQRIAAGRLQNRVGETVQERINGGLVRADGFFLYPVRQSIPVLQVNEAIPLV